MRVKAAAKNHAPTVVLGLGDTGLSCVRHLRARGVRVMVNDSRAAPPHLKTVRAEFPEVAVRTGGFDRELLHGAAAVVLSPGIDPADAGAAAAGCEVLGDMELFARAIRTEQPGARLLAVTGSNGKSTVTALAQAICRGAGINAVAGGNLGPPALDILDTGAAVFVLEVSSFQLQTTASLAPRAAVVTNVTSDHADRHPDAAAYAALKESVYRGAAVCIVNRDDPAVRAMKVPEPAVTFGRRPPAAAADYGITRHRGGDWLARGDSPLVDTQAMRLRGAHNHQNALAAMALAEAAGADPGHMAGAVTAFAGLPHRFATVAVTAGGVTWINDSKGTNPAAAAAALNSAPAGRTVWIAGGDGKGADFTAAAAAAARARAIIVLGRDGPRIADAVGAAAVTVVDSVAAAVTQAAAVAGAGDTVLFSPACASFDQYANFAARGDDFCAQVARLPQEAA
ncbi:MAG: UDP-N-acetylmuramoyl-L-alanine--D-glutamate ligase [Gammaproteobacteria bacterium]|nr:UDP-N-acetylmuramoyl-L-alanine--D-glutamate ligase [Gammaproteobacteria bacterium]MDD9800271.1 UDP-N-acetylmuramoyl-L-alanine--D-glutamate ligase [Gammaproteobacteria bacterium]MDD9850874.1 UDP-N-acetylmuramoyl-L-alanine--D-glutamate ligase [Gammaproteobacteria bacterium]MDD9870890.1 UDP-N-acetylmuramoyl-L-alanine--D-glutamate ligase [Gammaproteobacteria bacterium]